MSENQPLLRAVNWVNGLLELGAALLRFLFALCDLIFFHRDSDFEFAEKCSSVAMLVITFQGVF